MSMTVTTQRRGSASAAPTALALRVDAALGLSPRTGAWLADHPQARQFVSSVTVGGSRTRELYPAPRGSGGLMQATGTVEPDIHLKSASPARRNKDLETLVLAAQRHCDRWPATAVSAVFGYGK
jgi:hypothetical protein